MTEQEVRTFHGVIKFLEQAKARRIERGLTMSTTARISWVDGALFVAEGGSGHTLTMDGAPDVGGRNLASRPMEVMLMGMGGCTAIDVVSMLKKQRQDIEGVEVSLVAERADDHPKVFTAVKLVYTVRGRKLNRALVERAVSACPTRSTARPRRCSRSRPT